MHPPLDRPHPHCEDVVQALKDCHDEGYLKKLTGGCNDLKTRLDACFKQEKEDLLRELTKDLPAQRKKQEEFIKRAFGKDMTFQEYLGKNEDYRRELERKQQRTGRAAS